MPELLARLDRELWIRFADEDRVTHVMKRVGVRGGSSVMGVDVPLLLLLGGLSGIVSEREVRMPERMAMPRVPVVLRDDC